MGFTRPLLAGALALASFAGTQAADAGCYGSNPQALVCATVHTGGLPTVDPKGNSVDGCITVDSVCVAPYSIPVPTVTPGSGPIVSATCRGENFRCAQIEI